MSDFITTRDPVTGWEAVKPTHRIVEVNPYDALIDLAYQRRDAEIDAALEAGTWDSYQSDRWHRLIERLQHRQDVWTVQHPDTDNHGDECGCEYCQAAWRLSQWF